MTKSELTSYINECIEEYLYYNESLEIAIESYNNEINNFGNLISSINENTYVVEAIDMNKIKEKAKKLAENLKEIFQRFIEFIKKSITKFKDFLSKLKNDDKTVNAPGIIMIEDDDTSTFNDINDLDHYLMGIIGKKNKEAASILNGDDKNREFDVKIPKISFKLDRDKSI